MGVVPGPPHTGNFVHDCGESQLLLIRFITAGGP